MEEWANKSRSEAIIILSSDEEEEEDVQELFKEFVSKVEQFVDQKDVVIFLKLKFAEARSEFVSSSKFKNELKWRTKRLGKSNGYIYTGDICKLLLAADSNQDDCKSKSDNEKKVVNGDSSRSSGETDVTTNSTREDVNNDIIHVTIDNGEEDNPATGVEKVPAKIAAPQPSTSPAKSSTSERLKIKKKDKRKRPNEARRSGSTPSPSKQPLTPRKRKRLVQRLEEKLKYVSDQIKILNQAELSLDEMNMGDSSYIQECRLKDRFNRIWDKICKVKGRPPDTGRVTEKEVKCRPTGFPEIDSAVNAFLKRKKGCFPDIFDINNVVLKAKKQHGLDISPQALSEMSNDIFVGIGNKLQKRRKRDFEFNFGCHLTDDYRASNDPALNNPALRKKLEENKRINKRALDEVFNKYTQYGRMKTREDSSSPTSSDSEERKPKINAKGTVKERFSQISVAESSDSSDNERDDFDRDAEGPGSDDEPAGANDVFDGGSSSGRSFKKKTHSILKLSDANENDLDDFVLKKPRQITERTQPTENKIENDTQNNMAAQSKETDLSMNCTVVELPSSVLSNSIDITLEKADFGEFQDECCNDNVRNTGHDFETETTEEPNVNKKQSATNVLKGHKIISLQDIDQSSNEVTKHQVSDSGEKSDSNQDKDDLITASGSSDSSAPGSNNISTSAEYSHNTGDILTPSVIGSSDTSTLVDNSVCIVTIPKENVTHEISQALVSPRNDKRVANGLSNKPNLVIPLTPVSLKNRKSSLLSLSTKKRKAEDGSLEFESPLKIFRNATLEIVEKKDNGSLDEADNSEQKAGCTVSSKSESEELSIAEGTANGLPAQTAVNGHSHLRKHETRKLALSLNKCGRNSPKKQKVTVSVSEIIVLSDDDSDS